MLIEILKQKLIENNNGFEVQLQGGNHFNATPVIENGEVIGVRVSNLGANGFLTINAFEEAIKLLEVSPGHHALKGNATGGHPLGSPELPLNSIEGHIAHTVYNVQIGRTVFRRITPIARILEWADICVNGHGYMTLR